jgi:hypothetical protein
MPVVALAGSIGFRNDTKGPVIVQGMSIINGVVRQGKRLTLQPGDVAYDTVVVPGNKLIIVRDAKQPTRTLYQGTIQCGRNNLFFSVKSVTEAKPAKGQKVAAPKVELEGVTPPSDRKSSPGSQPSAPRR